MTGIVTRAMECLSELIENLIKWIFFGRLLVETDTGETSQILPHTEQREQVANRDGYLQYYDHGLKQTVNLKEGVTYVGSSWRADCVIDRPQIRAKHAEIIRKNGEYAIRNLSTGGSVRVNGDPLPKNGKKKIAANTVIYLCGLEILFQRWTA